VLASVGIGDLADNNSIIMRMVTAPTKDFDEILAEELEADPAFRAEWQRLAPAREIATTLIRYRAEHGLSQRALAQRLGISQPRVAKLESGEHNTAVDTIINVVGKLDVEFALDVRPVGRKPALVTARAQRNGAVAHGDVLVVAASA